MTVTFSSIQWSEYDVSAATLSEVVDLLEGQDEAGRCDWNPRWTADESDGVVTEATVDVDIEIWLPRWTDADGANDLERDEWARFLGALRDHEQGHADIAHRHLEHVDDAMVGLSMSDASAAFDDCIQTLQDASDAYDASTDHGRNTGTIITVPG